jgi:hypothetical protein
MEPGYWLVKEISAKDIIAVLALPFHGLEIAGVPAEENLFTGMCAVPRGNRKYFEQMAQHASSLQGLDRILYITARLRSHPSGTLIQQVACSLTFLKTALADEGLSNESDSRSVLDTYFVLTTESERLREDLLGELVERLSRTSKLA